MEDTILTIIIALGTGLAGSFSGWFFGRKKQNIENIDFALTTWQKVVDSLEKRVEVLQASVDYWTKENDELRRELAHMKLEIAKKENVDKDNEVLKSKLIRYEKLLADNNIKY